MNGSCVTAPPAAAVAVAVAGDCCVAAAFVVGAVVAVGDAGGGVSGGSDGSVVTTLEPGCSVKDKDKIQACSRALAARLLSGCRSYGACVNTPHPPHMHWKGVFTWYSVML